MFTKPRQEPVEPAKTDPNTCQTAAGTSRTRKKHTQVLTKLRQEPVEPAKNRPKCLPNHGRNQSNRQKQTQMLTKPRQEPVEPAKNRPKGTGRTSNIQIQMFTQPRQEPIEPSKPRIQLHYSRNSRVLADCDLLRSRRRVMHASEPWFELAMFLLRIAQWGTHPIRKDAM